MDLLDFYRGRLSLRRLMVLVRQLPPSGAVARAFAGDTAGWGLQEQLLALAVDALHAANWQRGNAGRKHPTPKPRPIPRPGVTDDRKRRRGEVLPVAEVKRRHAKYRPVGPARAAASAASLST